MTRRWIIWVAVVLAVAVQLAWAPRWGVLGGHPDVVTLVAVCLAFVDGPLTGAVAGFAGGLVLDMLGLGVVGVGALARTVAAFAAGLAERATFGRGLIVPMLATAAATAVAQLAEMMLLIAVGRSIPIVVSVVGVVIPAAVYNCALAGVVYPLLASLGQPERGPASIEPLS